MKFILILVTSLGSIDSTKGGYIRSIKDIGNNCVVIETTVENETFTSKICKIK
jgi:hypothetical protein